MMVTFFAPASMEFSTNSAMALSGLFCESAMILMTFQWSPIFNVPDLTSFFVGML